MAPRLAIEGDELRWGDRRAPLASVRALAERVSPWSGAAWLDIEGPGWRLPIDADYGADRALLREHLAAVPFDADWFDGRFPARPAGLPAGIALAGAVAGALGIVAAAAAWGPTWAPVVAGAAAAWPVLRLRDRVVVRADGLRTGPAWAPSVPWHEVHAVAVDVRGHRARVWAHTARGASTATVPSAIVPALRARLWRLGGVAVTAGPDAPGRRYALWRAPASGVPWGIAVGTALAAPLVDRPWTALTAGLLAVAATAALSAAVEARATGWGVGGVLFATLAYAAVLAAIALGSSGIF